MLIVLSHAVAFSTLFLGAIFDLKTTEVPDWVSVTGVLGGIFLHLMASLNSGLEVGTLVKFSLLLNQPLVWLQALGDPLLWCLGIGLAFSVYGWGLYFLGMWGGADAFAMSILGFAAPYSIAGPGIIHAANLFLNIMIAGFLYTIAFALYKSFQNPEVWKQTLEDIKQQEKRISFEIFGAALLSALGEFTASFNGVLYFSFFVGMIFAYRFLKNIQDDVMVKEVSVSELEGGEVLGSDEELGGKIVGLTQEDIESIEKDKVEVRDGIKFVPVFVIALVLTDVFGLGIEFFQLLIS